MRRMISRAFGSFLFFCLVVLLAEPIVAAVSLEAPLHAVRGSAFVAKATSSDPTERFVFHWLGKRHLAHAQKVGDTWMAKLLLPVPLDTKEDILELRSAALAPGQSLQKAQIAARAQVRLVDKKRPVQRLSVDKKYVSPPAAVQERIKKDRQKVRKALGQHLGGRSWSLPFARPVPGSVSSPFGVRRVFNGQPRGMHRGLDLRGAEGTPVLACADGQVVLAEDLYFSGNAVYLGHGEGVFTAYIHLSRILVGVGQKIHKGQVIGLVGATGRVTGPHLHLSLFVQGHAVDPEPLLARTSQDFDKEDIAKSDRSTQRKSGR